MSLDHLFAEPDDPMVNKVQTLSEKIKQRRTQMMVHSYLYYEMDANIIDDDTWQRWADELVELQKRKATIGFYDEEFSDWTGATGMHLPKDKWIENRAKRLLYSKKK